MVYCGKPSRGCQSCRLRRIKCDETRPTCKQCAKSRRQCPGYKNDIDLMSRNETKAIERRAPRVHQHGQYASEGQEPHGQSSSPPDMSTVSTFDSNSSPVREFLRSPSGESISSLLALPTDLHASCHFFSNFILIPREGSTRGYMDYLVPLIKAEPPDSALTQAFSACALSHLGNRVRSVCTDFEAEALTQYTKALSATHAALKNPATSKSDATLAAVLLLGLYENISAKQMGMFAWGSHIEGAIQLVKQRGRKQIRTKVGLLLFIGVRTQMVFHHLLSGRAPSMGIDWWLDDAVQNQAAAALQRINLKTSELRADMTRLMTITAVKTPESVAAMQVLARQTHQTDQDCARWLRDVPAHWKYKTVTWEDSVLGGDYSKAEVFPGRVDVYSDYYMASVWNMARVTRLILASITVRCAAWVCSPVDYRTTPEYATTTRICVDTITDIIASIPYHLGWHLKPERKALLEKQLSGFACGNDETPKGLAGYFATWPLGTLIGQDHTTDAQRVWVAGRLKYVANELGVSYAHIISKLNIRIPSMLIRRDGMMTHPFHSAHDLVKLVETREISPPPTSDHSTNLPLQRETMAQRRAQAGKRQLLTKATGTSDTSEDFVAKNWLKV